VIIGNGNIAKVLIDREDLIFFASGTSNSSCKDNLEFERELNLIRSIDKSKHIVYFSNLAIYYKNDPYTNHKIEVENYIRNTFEYYTIVRIEVCEWVNNKTTILNVFKEKIKNKESIEIQDTHRYVLSLEEFLYWVSLIKPNTKNEMNILGRRMSILEIVNEIKEGKI
jgi:UDP-2-acetamido-2,6-beta-L-arabino-hexul-4-ose reductase